MFILTNAEKKLLPTDDDVSFYREHGWFQTPRLFDDSEIDDAITAVDRHHNGIRDAEPPMTLHPIGDWRQGSDFPIRLSDYVALTNHALRALVGKPLLAAIAARLAETRQIRLWQSTIVYKEPKVVDKYATIGWHTDRAYSRCCSSTRMLAAWIALQDCDESMGALTMIDGSHRWPATREVLEVRLGDTFMGTDPATLQARIEHTAMPIRHVAMNLRKGQVSFHHCMILHGSRPNVSDHPRIGITVHLQDAENRYQRVVEQSMAYTHNNDEVCRKQSNGEPDYCDPSICPVLWEDSGGPEPNSFSLS